MVWVELPEVEPFWKTPTGGQSSRGRAAWERTGHVNDPRHAVTHRSAYADRWAQTVAMVRMSSRAIVRGVPLTRMQTAAVVSWRMRPRRRPYVVRMTACRCSIEGPSSGMVSMGRQTPLRWISPLQR